MQATNPLPLFPVGQSKRVIEEKNYDRSPDLSPEERKVLARIARRLKQGKQAGQLLSLPGLRRLMIPLFDLCALSQKKQKSTYQQVLPFLIEMHQRNASFWGWSEAQWVESIGLTYQACQQRHGANCAYVPRPEFLAAAYLFGGFSNFGVFPKNSISCVRLANDIFGEELLTTPRHMMLERGAHSNWAKNFTPDHRLDRSFDRKVYTSFEKADARHDRVQNLRYEDIFSPLFVVTCREKKQKGAHVMAEQLMETTLRTALWQQFGATIDMLENALLACPSMHWHGLLWSDPGAPEYPTFWSITHHTLFWLDLHLTGSLEGFAPPAPFTLDELDPAGVLPEQPYTKEELHAYLVHLRKKCQTTIAELSDEKAHQQVAFPWARGKQVSYLELLLYSMRHVQEHAAQLSLFLGQHGIPDEALDWVERAKGEASL